jgi:hypothetical protein
MRRLSTSSTQPMLLTKVRGLRAQAAAPVEVGTAIDVPVHAHSVRTEDMQDVGKLCN